MKWYTTDRKWKQTDIAFETIKLSTKGQLKTQTIWTELKKTIKLKFKLESIESLMVKWNVHNNELIKHMHQLIELIQNSVKYYFLKTI